MKSSHNATSDHTLHSILFFIKAIMGLILLVTALFFYDKYTSSKESSTGVIFQSSIEVGSQYKSELETKVCVFHDKPLTPIKAAKIAIEEMQIKRYGNILFVGSCAAKSQFVPIHSISI